MVRSVAFALSLALGLAPSVLASGRPLRVDDAFRLADVSEPRIDPDGEAIVYAVTRRSLEKDAAESRLYLVPATGGEPVPLTAPGSSASRPRFSPDGRFVSFLRAGEDGKAQVYTLDRRGGEALALTDVPQGVEAYEWAPDGRRLVLVLRDPRPEEAAEAGDGKKKKTPPPWVIDRLQFKRDGVGYLDRRRTHLYLLDVATRALRQITFGDFDDAEPAFSPDGRSIVFVSNRTEEPDANYNTDLWLVPAEGGEARPEPRRLTTNEGPDRAPAFSPDGRRLVYLTTVDDEHFFYATTHLAVVGVDGGAPRVLTERLDRNVFAPRFAPGGERILFVVETEGEQRLAAMPADGGAIEWLVSGSTVVDAFDVARSGRIALLATRPHLPPELFVLEAGALEQRTATNAAVLADLELAPVEKTRATSPDGTPVEAFLVRPTRGAPPYPTVLWIHGGPQAQYDHRFDFLAQLFAARGYLVVLPNPRGSTGYGQAFCLGIWRAWGEKDTEDVLAAVDDAIARGLADPDRLAVGGWSYGGMLTNHVITKTDRFRAAISGASATLYVANYGHDHYQRWWERELGLPWRAENRPLWERLSPFNRVENVRTPTLILCGEKDWNVPVVNSEQLYQALRRLGVPTRLVVYPGEDHGIDTPSYVKDRYERYLDWLDRYVRGRPAPTEP